MDYSVILKYSTTDKCYIVSVPDLPGCMADGKTPNEAYENAKLVIKQWIDTVRAAGREILTAARTPLFVNTKAKFLRDRLSISVPFLH